MWTIAAIPLQTKETAMTHRNKILFRFLWVMVLLIAVLVVTSLGLEYFMSYDLPKGISIVVVIVPAMDAGQQFYKLENRCPEKSEAWRYGACFVAINAAFGLALGLLGVGTGFLGVFAQLGVFSVLAIMAFVLAIYLGTARVFFGMGAKQQEKLSQKA
jgi:hypothetical protein